MAQNNLGMMYYNGQGVPKDQAEAVRLCRKAADQNNRFGLRNLAFMYQHGEGIAKDLTEAARLYRKAADQDDAYAQLRLAEMYESGEGVAKDLAEAVKWYRKTAERGNVESMNSLAWSLATSMDPKLRDGSNAVKFAERAVAARSPKDPNMLDTLAAAYAEAGEFPKAVSTQKEAIGLLGDEQAKKDFATRLKLYESNTPYRQRE
jgi:TPR repeat protein